ncbi:MAG: isochorismatase family protein, partial [Pseudomonadota bacterium]|nr:isochorismatase family protein [Pseudomonadota bacterium]
YGDREIGFGRRPAVVVVDFQRAFTDPDMEFGGCELVQRAIQNTARVLEVARRANVPVANCYTAYHSERDMPPWKIGPVHDSFYYGDPCTEIEPKTSDPNHDFIFCKTGPSIFFNTPCTTLLAKNGIDTTIITGCMTSGCIRASIIDSFSHGYRTMVPEDCVGDAEEGPHNDNLRDVGRRYADVIDSQTAIDYLEDYRTRNN